MRKCILAGLVAVWATTGAAHSPLDVSQPANEAVIAEVPAELVLGFKGKIRLTRVSVSVSGDEALDLNLKQLKGFVSEYRLPLPQMGEGTYDVDWRGLGDDGHALNGSFSFTVKDE